MTQSFQHQLSYKNHLELSRIFAFDAVLLKIGRHTWGSVWICDVEAREEAREADPPSRDATEDKLGLLLIMRLRCVGRFRGWLAGIKCWGALKS